MGAAAKSLSVPPRRLLSVVPCTPTSVEPSVDDTSAPVTPIRPARPSLSPFVSFEPFTGCAEYDLCRAVEAHADGTRTECIVKWLRSSDPAQQAKFVKDARRAIAVDHPNIVRVRRAGTHEGRPYIVRDYVHGANLRSLMEHTGRSGVPLPVILRLGERLATALDYLHSGYNGRDERLGMVHGELRPTNILVSRSGQPMLTELAIGAPRRPPIVHGITDRYRIGYLAPERLQGKAGGPRTDVFALGLVLLELVGKEPLPRSGGFGSEAAARFAHTWCSRRKDLPLRFRTLLIEMTADAARDRPTMADTKARLSALVERIEDRQSLDGSLRRLMLAVIPSGDVAPKVRPRSIEPPPLRPSMSPPTALNEAETEIGLDLEPEPAPRPRSHSQRSPSSQGRRLPALKARPRKEDPNATTDLFPADEVPLAALVHPVEPVRPERLRERRTSRVETPRKPPLSMSAPPPPLSQPVKSKSVDPSPSAPAEARRVSRQPPPVPVASEPPVESTPEPVEVASQLAASNLDADLSGVHESFHDRERQRKWRTTVFVGTLAGIALGGWMLVVFG